MMKPSTSFFLLVSAGILLISPGRASAWLLPDIPKDVSREGSGRNLVAQGSSLSSPIAAENANAFCTGLAATRSSMTEKLNERSQALSGKLATGEERTDRRDMRDASLAEARGKADERRSEWYLRLGDEAENGAEKKAVDRFKQTVEEAIDERRAKVDDSLADFRDSVDTLLTGRETEAEAAREAFASAVLSALGQAETDCAEKVSPAILRKKFRESLAVARQILKRDREKTTVVKSDIQTLVSARQKDFDRALADFEVKMEKARVELKAALDQLPQ